MIDPRHPALPSTFTLKDLMAVYCNPGQRPSTLRRTVIVFGNLLRHFGLTPIQDLTASAIRQYLDANTRSDATKALEMRVLRAALNRAVALDLLFASRVQSLVPRIRVTRRPQHNRPLTPQEVLQFLQTSPTWLQVPILFALHTGLRFDELANVKWEHINWHTSQVTVPSTSFRRQRHVPLLPPVRIIIARLRDLERGSGLLFKTPNGCPLGETTKRLMRRSSQKAGLPTIHPKDLRRTFVAWCVYAGMSPLTIADITGYTSMFRSSVTAWLDTPRPDSVMEWLTRKPNNFSELASLLKKAKASLNPIIVP